MLRATALLRQLLVDGNRLVDVVNRSRKERIRFSVVDAWGTPLAKAVMALRPAVYSVGDGLDPETNVLPAAKVISLTRDQFLKFRVAFANGRYFTIGDVISHCANVLGGVHIGEPKTATEHDLSALQALRVGGVPLSIRQIWSILEVSTAAPRPLYDRIKLELEHRGA